MAGIAKGFIALKRKRGVCVLRSCYLYTIRKGGPDKKTLKDCDGLGVWLKWQNACLASVALSSNSSTTKKKKIMATVIVCH
jgi:hypothetical protein